MTNEEAAKLLKRVTAVTQRGSGKGFYASATFEALNMAIEALELAPTLARPKGKWILNDVQYGSTSFRCSACNDVTDDVPTCCNKPLFNFCPACGADMREEADNDPN